MRSVQLGRSSPAVMSQPRSTSSTVWELSNIVDSKDLILFHPVTLSGAVLFILFGFIYAYEFLVDVSATPSPES